MSDKERERKREREWVCVGGCRSIEGAIKVLIVDVCNKLAFLGVETLNLF